MKIIGSIQARVGSTRFPGKVLKEICGKPMLLWQVERIKRSRLLDDIIVATTLNPRDDEIVKLCKKHDIKFFRGSENDVLKRISALIKLFKIDTHVEFLGDSPLPDAHIIDEIIGFYLKYRDKYDYVSNALKITYPPGMDVSVFKGAALITVDRKVPKDEPLREHLSLHIIRDKRYKKYNLEAPDYHRFPDISLEVDTPEDFKLISNIVNYFTNRGEDYFSLTQILGYLKQNKDLLEINKGIPRRWKKFKEGQ